MRKQWRKILVAFTIFIVTNTCLITAIGGETPNDGLDQQQTQENHAEYIYNQRYIAQSFKPSLGNLTRIQLCLSKRGDISTNITISIREASLTGPDLINKSIPPSNIPSEKQWVQINFTNITLEISESHQIAYYIVCRTQGGNRNNSFMWYASDTDAYKNGTKYFSSGVTWFQDCSCDLCFKTYGNELIEQSDLEITYIKGGTGSQINYGIKNIGEEEINSIHVFMELKGGLILTGRNYTDKFTNLKLDPEEESSSLFYPVIGLGRATITLYVWSENVDTVQKTKDAFLLLFYIYIEP